MVKWRGLGLDTDDNKEGVNIALFKSSEACDYIEWSTDVDGICVCGYMVTWKVPSRILDLFNCFQDSCIVYIIIINALRETQNLRTNVKQTISTVIHTPLVRVS